jgi:predicted  nucleic acid-binding Zn-ribbon protein
LIRQISVRDHALKVRRQATIALKELEDIEESKIELDLVTAENTYQSLKVHLPTLRKRKRIIEFQISNLEWRIQDTRSNGDRLRLRDECARKQRSLDELERMIQRIQEPFAQDRRSI